ncbi:MAG: hypothetical protein J6B87_03625 [Clostridia bacterium]|nr:hypothetical protein [Clostridia bacterium]
MVISYVLGVLAVIGIMICFSVIGYKMNDEEGALSGSITGLFTSFVGGMISYWIVNESFSNGCLVTCVVIICGGLLGVLIIMIDSNLWCNWFSSVAFAIIVFAMIITLVVVGVQIHEKENIVLLPETDIVETRYDILGGSDSSRVSGYVSGTLYRTHGAVGETDCFKLYYEEERNGEYIAVPMVISENSTTVVLMKEGNEVEHVIKTEKIFYREDRNVDPYEVSVDHVEVSYKLYVNEATFTGLQFDGN